MKFKVNRKPFKYEPSPTIGDIKIIRIFLWLPYFNEADDTWYWLETVNIRQRWTRGFYNDYWYKIGIIYEPIK